MFLFSTLCLINFYKKTISSIWVVGILLFSFESLARDFKNEDMLNLLRNNPQTGQPIDSMSDLVAALPLELRSNFTFVYKSRSPFHESISFEYPRAILFSEDAKFVITYTGDPSKPGYNTIETMEFNDDKAEFTFQIFDLKEKDKISKSLKSSSCVDCHGKDTRPIFDSYPLWPGFYGSVLDSFPKNIASVQKEKERFVDFLKTVPQKDAYANLVFKKGSKVSPYLETEKLLLNENNEAVNPETDFKPNERFGISLTALNKKRLFRKIKSSQKYETLKKEILYELLDCGTSKITKSRVDKIEKALTLENEKRVEKMEAEGFEKKHKLLQMQELLFPRELAQIDWMSEELGVSREDWSMALEKNSLSYFDGILSGMHKDKVMYLKEDFIFEILKDLSENEQSYKNFFKVGYTLAHYDLAHIDKIDWASAEKSCGELGKDILSARFKKYKAGRFTQLKLRFVEFLDRLKTKILKSI